MSNKAILIGTINDKEITTIRSSSLTDTIPINTNKTGYYKVTGQLHTYNTPDRHLKLYIEPTTIEPTEEPSDNTITLTGYLCKSPNYRTTPAGRQITDLLLAVNREDYKSDYIPCIAWGKNAQKATQYKIGDKITITGRIQSRQYLKNDTTQTTIEISVTKLSLDKTT